VEAARSSVIEALDSDFYRTRFDRLTPRLKRYARALAEFGDNAALSSAVADVLGMTVQQAAPDRDDLIKEGAAYSPEYGRVAFTVPGFDQFMKRRMPKVERVPRRPVRSQKRRRRR
jgi:hypothetical protein